MSCEDQGFSRIADGCLQCVTGFKNGKPIHPQFIKQRSPSNASLPNGGPLYYVCPQCKGYYGEVRRGDGPKEREPQIVKRNPDGKRPPIRPFGTRFEFWGGVVGIGRDLTIYDYEWAVGHVNEIRQRDRKAIARYMIALWKRFEAGK